MVVNRTRYKAVITIPGMDRPASSKVLWNNVKALMDHHYGEENLNRLAREAKFGPGTASRIKEQKTSAGLDTLDKVARAFNLETWQLLVPGLDPAAPPAAVPQPRLSPSELSQVEQARQLLHDMSPAQKDLFINSEDMRAMMERAPYPVEKMDPKWSASRKSPSRRSGS